MSMNTRGSSRRDFLKDTGRFAAASAVMAAVGPQVYAQQSQTIKVALIGCGGRGSGAASNALSVRRGPTKLVAMADVFEGRLKSSYGNLKQMHADQVDVPESRRFIGFDAYKHAMDCLDPGDIAIFATPPAFRWVHFTYAIGKKLNVFMEKPVTVDGPTSRRMFDLAKQATAKNLKVGVGLMSRHSRALEQLYQRIRDGEIGDIVLQRAYRMHGPIGYFASLPKPPGISHLLYQVQRFHSFIWASGGNYSDFYIHLIDHQAWMKDAWPVKAQALGGRHYKTSPEGVMYVDQNFDTYSVEYTYADGSTFLMDGRCMTGCKDIYSSYAHGSKGMAVVSRSGDCGMPSSTHKGQNPTRETMIWESKVRPQESNPYQNEWEDLMDAIRDDKPYNETERGVRASLVTSMGRMAAHTGQEVTYEQILNSDHEMAPGLDKLTMESPAPLQAGPDGRYPVPQPGIVKDREY
ncbi:MAG TPA: Gfo/Idh/MocA family oxidoreductase [Phycisphaerales bacterium]|nr:Gfo/Idh/MocA family oxidoreductase [Phycisphaerales bacterium]